MNHSDSTMSLSIKTDAIGMLNSLSSLESLESKDVSSLDYLETTMVDGQMSEFNTTTNSNETLTLDPVLIERFTRNRSIDGPWYHVLILLYSVLIIFGSLGNILVVMAVVRKPIMRTARNLFILNLAISGKFKIYIHMYIKTYVYTICFLFYLLFVYKVDFIPVCIYF